MGWNVGEAPSKNARGRIGDWLVYRQPLEEFGCKRRAKVVAPGGCGCRELGGLLAIRDLMEGEKPGCGKKRIVGSGSFGQVRNVSSAVLVEVASLGTSIFLGVDVPAVQSAFYVQGQVASFTAPGPRQFTLQWQYDRTDLLSSPSPSPHSQTLLAFQFSPPSHKGGSFD